MPVQLSTVLKVLITLLTAFSNSINPRHGKTVTVSDEIRKAGYPVEFHSVTTEDGYILGVHRIPYSPKSPDQPNKPVVFLQHGITTCSAAWVLAGSDKSLSYLLADLGYDVWIGNIRGNFYSRNHTTLDPDTDKAFWNYSFHELGVYDMPATIDYILELTRQPKLFYVGYSQGSTEFFVMASERPEYNDKIRVMIGFAPIVTLAQADTPLAKIVQALNLNPQMVENAVGVGEILPRSPFYFDLVSMVYNKGGILQIICETVIFFATGFDWEQTNRPIVFPEISRHIPSGLSSKQFLHFYQGLVRGKFRQYDLGRRGNLLRYGTELPPKYNLSKVTAPVALYYGSSDWLASEKGVDILYNDLANPILKLAVPFPQFNHLDFMYAKDARTLLFNQVADLMSLY